MTNKMYNESFNTCKFVLSIFIIILHFDYNMCHGGYLATESFFVLNGLFIGFQINKILKVSIFTTLLSRPKNWYIQYLIVIFISFICFKPMTFNGFLAHLFLLQGLGIHGLPLSWLWYLSCYILTTIILISIFKMAGIEKGCCVVGLILIIAGILLESFSITGSTNLILSDVNNMVPYGLIRAVFNMGAGCLIGIKLESQTFISRKKYSNFFYCIFITLVELACVIYIGICIFDSTFQHQYDILYTLVFLTFIYELNKNRGMVGVIFNVCGKNLKKCFSLSMPMYLVHGIFITHYLDYLGGQWGIVFYFLVVITSAALLNLIAGFLKMWFSKYVTKKVVL